MNWFGENFGPVCDEGEQVPIPAGRRCFWCEEAIEAGEEGVMMPVEDSMPEPAHRECFFRMVVGSLGHQMRKCACYGGHEDDPKGMTKREAARAALACYHLTKMLGSSIPMTYFLSNDNKAITCLRCGMTSYNSNDVEQCYCGHCHIFHSRKTGWR